MRTNEEFSLTILIKESLLSSASELFQSGIIFNQINLTLFTKFRKEMSRKWLWSSILKTHQRACTLSVVVKITHRETDSTNIFLSVCDILYFSLVQRESRLPCSNDYVVSVSFTQLFVSVPLVCHTLSWPVRHPAADAEHLPGVCS